VGQQGWRAQPGGDGCYGESRRQRKYEVRGRHRLRVNREARKKVEQAGACGTGNAMLLQLGLTVSNTRKRKCKSKRRRQPQLFTPSEFKGQETLTCRKSKLRAKLRTACEA